MTDRYPDRVFMIMIKRISQGEYLLDKLIELGESVTHMFGDTQEYDVDARILIGMISKVGVGFDHPNLDAMLLAIDAEAYYIQYLGRVLFRTKKEPLIIDMVDNFSTLNKHYKERAKIYKQTGGKIKQLKL